MPVSCRLAAGMAGAVPPRQLSKSPGSQTNFVYLLCAGSWKLSAAYPDALFHS